MKIKTVGTAVITALALTLVEPSMADTNQITSESSAMEMVSENTVGMIGDYYIDYLDDVTSAAVLSKTDDSLMFLLPVPSGVSFSFLSDGNCKTSYGKIKVNNYYVATVNVSIPDGCIKSVRTDYGASKVAATFYKAKEVTVDGATYSAMGFNDALTYVYYNN